MRHFIGCGLLGLAVLGFAGADDSAKVTEKDTLPALLKLIVSNRTEAADLLAKITDEKAAKELTPRLAKNADALTALYARLKKLGPPAAAVDKSLQQTIENDYRTALTKIHSEAARLRETAYGSDVLKALRTAPALTPSATPTNKTEAKKPPKAG